MGMIQLSLGHVDAPRRCGGCVNGHKLKYIECCSFVIWVKGCILSCIRITLVLTHPANVCSECSSGH